MHRKVAIRRGGRASPGPVIWPVAQRAPDPTARDDPAPRRPGRQRLDSPRAPPSRHPRRCTAPTLSNGLRVLVVPDQVTPVVGVAVHVDVGFRSEPEGRTGFAHLFEHLMFQGSESLEKLAHFRHVQSSGGVFNGSTHQDYTDYFEVLPAAALERALFLEADRLRAPKLTDGEPAQPGRRGQGGDPAQRAEPALRRVPVDPAAPGALRHVPQRAQRLRRLLRARAGLARRRRRLLRHLLRPGQRPAHGGRLPRRRRDAAAGGAALRRHPGPRHPALARRSPNRRRARTPAGGARRARPAARARARLPAARPGRRSRRLPGPRAAGLGARRRRGRPVAAPAGARRRAGHGRLGRRRADGPAGRPRPGHLHDHRGVPGARRPGSGARRRSTRSWTSWRPRARARGAGPPGRRAGRRRCTRRTTG